MDRNQKFNAKLVITKKSAFFSLSKSSSSSSYHAHTSDVSCIRTQLHTHVLYSRIWPYWDWLRAVPWKWWGCFRCMSQALRNVVVARVNVWKKWNSLLPISVGVNDGYVVVCMWKSDWQKCTSHETNSLMSLHWMVGARKRSLP